MEHDTPRVGRIPRHNQPSPTLSAAMQAAIVVVGTAGLVALAVAIVGPKRIHRGVYEPLRDAIEPYTENWIGRFRAD
jgi:hypothetical protein